MLPFADLPPLIQERVICSVIAAKRYQIPTNILLAVAEKEGGKPDQWVRNSNGTYDVGPMQFNTAYLGDLSRHGITANDVAASGCYAYDLAAWRLRMHIRNDKGDLWRRAANYHSRTAKYNSIYRVDLKQKANKWAHWLEVNFKTLELTKRSGMHNNFQKSSLQLKPTVYPTRARYIPRQIIINNRADDGNQPD